LVNFLKDLDPSFDAATPQVLTKDFEIKLFYVTAIVQVPERYGYWVNKADI
jgi:hypothetical protein